MLDEGRKADLMKLDRARRQTQSRGVRASIDRAIHHIVNETQKQHEMRAELIRAHQEGNHAEIQNIQEFIDRHPDYRNQD